MAKMAQLSKWKDVKDGMHEVDGKDIIKGRDGRNGKNKNGRDGRNEQNCEVKDNKKNGVI